MKTNQIRIRNSLFSWVSYLSTLLNDWVTKKCHPIFLSIHAVFRAFGDKIRQTFYRRYPNSKPQLNPPQRGFRLIFQVGSHAFLRFSTFFPVVGNAEVLALCQDLVQVKMRNFFQIQPARSSALVCALLYTRSNSSGDIKSQWLWICFVCKKLPDIRKSTGMPACNREF